MKVLNYLVIALIVFFVIDWALSTVMMKGVNNYYGLGQDSEILLIGHSHLMLATDKQRIEDETGMKVSKYCREGVNVTDRQTMVNHYLNNGHTDSLKYVLYGVDLCTFTGEGLSKNSYMLFYPFIDNSYVGSYISTQSSATDYWLHKLIRTSRFNDEGLKNSVLRGWTDNWSNLKTNTIDIENYKKKLANHDERSINMNPELIRQFTSTIDSITKRRVKVILVNTPTLDLLNDYEPDKYRQIMQWFTDYAARDSLVEFWDFNPEYSHDYSIFSDRLHLNQKGQQIITTEIIKRLNAEK